MRGYGGAMTDDISREHEPSGFGRVVGGFLGLGGVVGRGWGGAR